MRPTHQIIISELVVSMGYHINYELPNIGDHNIGNQDLEDQLDNLIEQIELHVYSM